VVSEPSRGPPEIDFQIATQAFRATWREPEGEERHKVWDFMVRAHPPVAPKLHSSRPSLALSLRGCSLA